MFISDLTHFLDEAGNIPKEMPTEAREMAGFLVMVVDLTTERKNTVLSQTALWCFNKGCNGIINTALTPNFKEIHWHCPSCNTEGIIRNWQGTRWNNIN